MFEYKLSYVNISIQRREIITLDRVDENGSIERLRAAKEKKYSFLDSTNYLNFYPINRETFEKNAAGHCYVEEKLLGSTPVDEKNEDQLRLYQRIHNLVQLEFNPFRTTFVGKTCKLEPGYASLVITELNANVQEFINGIFDEAKRVLQPKEVAHSELVVSEGKGKIVMFSTKDSEPVPVFCPGADKNSDNNNS